MKPRTELATATSQMLQLAQRITADRLALRNMVATASVPALKEWVANAPAALVDLLSTRINDPWIILPTLLAVRELSTHAAFDGDSLSWYAKVTGFGASEINRYLHAARWLYQPGAFPLGPEDKHHPPARRTAIAKTQQTELREVLRKADLGLWGVHACMEQTKFLCEQAKSHTLPIIKNVLAEVGPTPAPKRLINELQIAVKQANRAYQPDQGHHGYLHFGHARHGMMSMRGFCAGHEGNMIRKTLREYANQVGIDRELPEAKRVYRALHHLCQSRTAPDNAPGSLAYFVNVTITAEEFQQLCAHPERKVTVDTGATLPWHEIAAGKATPIDAVTIIGSAGEQMRQYPQARFFSPEQRAWMLAFQTRCAHPECDVPARECQAHHMVPVARGGTTTAANLILLCPRHHAVNDDSHSGADKFHYAKDENGIPYLDKHGRGGPGSPPDRKYNPANLRDSAAARALSRHSNPPQRARHSATAPTTMRC